jgi:Uma2 family endonuclease
LDTYFAAAPEVYVSGNLMCYYVEGDTSHSVSPEVFVVRGAAKHERRIYKFWEEPAPKVVLEISSRKTRKEDVGKTKELYAWLGVREYFVFDQEYREEVVSHPRVRSHELGLELVNMGQTLRLYNPQTEGIPTHPIGRSRLPRRQTPRTRS